MPDQDVVEHFTARAQIYDRSSRWCTDPDLMAKLIQVAAPLKTDRLLDVACGTGLVSKGFRPHLASIVGVDPTEAMASQAKPWLDAFELATAERLPFAAGEFDITICRQGIQFMDAERAAAEMVRVTARTGRVILVNLCAYDDVDRAEYNEILRLRNPARRNFFVPADLGILLEKAGCARVELHSWISEEDVDLWSNNGAIEIQSCQRIRDLYVHGSARFKERHGIRRTEHGSVIDRMLFAIAVGYREP